MKKLTTKSSVFWPMSNARVAISLLPGVAA